MFAVGNVHILMIPSTPAISGGKTNANRSLLLLCFAHTDTATAKILTAIGSQTTCTAANGIGSAKKRVYSTNAVCVKPVSVSPKRVWYNKNAEEMYHTENISERIKQVRKNLFFSITSPHTYCNHNFFDCCVRLGKKINARQIKNHRAYTAPTYAVVSNIAPNGNHCAVIKIQHANVGMPAKRAGSKYKVISKRERLRRKHTAAIQAKAINTIGNK